MNESKIKNKIIMLTVLAVLLVFVLIGLLVYQYVNYWELAGKQTELNRQLEALKEQRLALEKDVNYKSSEGFIEDYVRDVLGWGKEGETYYD